MYLSKAKHLEWEATGKSVTCIEMSILLCKVLGLKEYKHTNSNTALLSIKLCNLRIYTYHHIAPVVHINTHDVLKPVLPRW